MPYIVIALVLGCLVSCSSSADAQSDKAKFQQAYRAYQEAIESQQYIAAMEQAKIAYMAGRSVYGDTHKNTANLSFNYAQTLIILGRRSEALPILKTSVDHYEKAYGEDAAELIDPIMALADASGKNGDRGKTAERYYRKALAIAEKSLGDDSYIEGRIRREIGTILLTDARSKRAKRQFESAQQIFEKYGDNARADLALNNFWFGKYELAAGHEKKAIGYFNASVDALNEIAPTSPTLLSAHAFLIEAYEGSGQSDKATKHCQAIGQATPYDKDQNYLPVYRVAPTYPQLAQRQGQEGVVIVSLTVTKEGFVRDIKTVEREGSHLFEKSAYEAARQFRYAPRFEDGKPVDTHDVKYRFTFGLRS